MVILEITWSYIYAGILHGHTRDNMVLYIRRDTSSFSEYFEFEILYNFVNKEYDYDYYTDEMVLYTEE